MTGWSPTRTDGWAPIEQYGLLSNGRTVALVAADGRIDWWPLPSTDSPPVFAALLDPERGGRLELRPQGECTVTREYVGESNVLATTFHTASGVVRVTDALTVGRAGRLPWGELVRRIEGLEGAVPMTWAVHPGTRFDSAEPWVQTTKDAVVVHCGDQHLALLCSQIGEPHVERQVVRGSFRTCAGSRSTFALSASDNAPVFLPTISDVEERLDRTVRDWHRWAGAMSYQGRWSQQVRRSGLALKMLLAEDTGAIAAAATTSLPERLGGDKNWDYRYMWVRDASFTVDAFLRLGLHEEVQAAVTWLLRAVRATAPDLKVFYRLDGSVPGGEHTLTVPGYRRSTPVRSGNGAAGQVQLGTFGDLFDSVWMYAQAGHVLDPPSGRLLADLADRCCDIWNTPDAGIWELHVDRHYTISKIGCWVALDRAVQLHERDQIATGHAYRWADTRDAIQTWVNEHCWSPRKASYTFYAGTDDLDAATLLAGPTGFERGPRLVGTIAAIQRELADGPLVYRYTGMQHEEGAFLACTFWLVNALSASGDAAAAAALMDQAVGLTNDLGLLSEQIDPTTGAMLGNVPQGLSHLALINAACAIEHRDGHPDYAALTAATAGPDPGGASVASIAIAAALTSTGGSPPTSTAGAISSGGE